MPRIQKLRIQKGQPAKEARGKDGTPSPHLQLGHPAATSQQLHRVNVLRLKPVALDDAEKWCGSTLEEVGDQGLKGLAGDGALEVFALVELLDGEGRDVVGAEDLLCAAGLMSGRKGRG